MMKRNNRRKEAVDKLLANLAGPKVVLFMLPMRVGKGSFHEALRDRLSVDIQASAVVNQTL